MTTQMYTLKDFQNYLTNNKYSINALNHSKCSECDSSKQIKYTIYTQLCICCAETQTKYNLIDENNTIDKNNTSEKKYIKNLEWYYQTFCSKNCYENAMCSLACGGHYTSLFIFKNQKLIDDDWLFKPNLLISDLNLVQDENQLYDYKSQIKDADSDSDSDSD